MKRFQLAILILAGVTAGAGISRGEISIRFRSGVATQPALRAEMIATTSARVQCAATFLARTTDYELDSIRDDLRIVVGVAPEPSGLVIPASYTFPDSTLRIMPDFALEPDRERALDLLAGHLVLAEPLEAILDRCTDGEIREVAAIVGDFITSEFVHELYHDWQNRIARFPAVEQGKVHLVAGGSAVGWDWRGYLKDHGVDLQEHDRQLLQAELEACLVQTHYWIVRYGPEPAHPLAAAFLRLMKDAAAYYSLAARVPEAS